MTKPSPTKNRTLQSGDFVGPYRIIRHIATGEHWTIYLARSGSEQRQVALKILHGDWMPPATLAERARLAKDIQNPHLARIYTVGADRGRQYVAQEFITDQRGAITDLRTERMDHGDALPENRVRVLAKQILDGLESAHDFIGGGLAHGQLDERTVLLNEQRRANIVDMGLFTDATPEAKAGDIRAAGRLFYLLLTGRECAADAPSPSDLGLTPGWNGILRDLTSATAESPPDLSNVAERILALDDRPRSRRWIFPAAATVLLLSAIAVLLVAFYQRNQRRLQALEERREETARASRAAADALLERAEKARTRMAFAEARALLEQARAEAPDHPDVDRFQADLVTMEGLTRVSEVKTRAEHAFAKIQHLNRNQGFDNLIRDAETRLTAARNALTEQAFDEAEKLYAEAAQHAETIAHLHSARLDAANARETTERHRDAADTVDAAAFADTLWANAEARHAQAGEAFESRAFEEAATAWKQAATLYERAANKADGTHRLTSARRAFESARVAAGEDARGAIPEPVKQKIAALSEEAEQLTKAEKWRDAAAVWDQARKALAEGIAQAERILCERHFNAAMARGAELARAKQYLAAEQAFREALAVKGYDDNAKASRLLKAVQHRLQELASTERLKPGNLVRNGDFSVGQGGAPVAWTQPDNLTVFWEEGGVSGKCIRMDTDVYRSEWEEHRKHPEVPMKKTPTSGTRYNTVGGTTGVAVYAYPIEVQPGAYYRVSYDVKGQGEPFLYIKGYWKCSAEHLKDMGEKIFFKPVPGGPSFSLVAFGTSGEEKRQPRAGDFIQSFRRRVVARFPGGGKGWRRFETVLQLPPDRPIQVVLLELYAFWPPGTYWFDNVRMEQVTQKDLEAYQARRRKLGEDANFGIPVK